MFLVFAGIWAWEFHGLKVTLPCVVQPCPSILLVRCLAIGIVLLLHSVIQRTFSAGRFLGLGFWARSNPSVAERYGRSWSLRPPASFWLGFGVRSLRSSHSLVVRCSSLVWTSLFLVIGFLPWSLVSFLGRLVHSGSHSMSCWSDSKQQAYWLYPVRVLIGWYFMLLYYAWYDLLSVLLFMFCMIEIYLSVWAFDVYGLIDCLLTEGF